MGIPFVLLLRGPIVTPPPTPPHLTVRIHLTPPPKFDVNFRSKNSLDGDFVNMLLMCPRRSSGSDWQPESYPPQTVIYQPVPKATAHVTWSYSVTWEEDVEVRLSRSCASGVVETSLMQYCGGYHACVARSSTSNRSRLLGHPDGITTSSPQTRATQKSTGSPSLIPF